MLFCVKCYLKLILAPGTPARNLRRQAPRRRYSRGMQSQKHRWGNCLFFVLAIWRKKGGYILSHKSPRGWWWHHWHSTDLVTRWEFTPAYPRTDRKLPPPIYRGIVKATRAGRTHIVTPW